MKQIKTLLVLILCLVIVCALSGCGGNGNDVSGSEVSSSSQSASAQETSSATTEDGKVTYQVTVVDSENNPISGALVQLCKDTCYPSSTDENGMATFSLAEDDYKVTFLTLPAGYTYSDEEQEFYFESGETELTITLKAAE